jgi:zinc transporter ZupT
MGSMEGLWTPLLAACVSAAVTTTGVVAISRFEEWARRNAVHFKGFAAGVLIAVSIMHLLPRAFSLSERPSLFILGAFLTVYVADHLLGSSGHSGTPGRSGLIPLAAVGMILHEFPEGIVTFVLVTRAGFSKGKAFVLAFLTAALTTPVGALVSHPFVSGIDRLVLGRLLAVAAGALLFVGTAHLLPEVRREGKAGSLLALGAGIALALLLILLEGL